MGGGRDEIIPCAYFNEVFVECRAELTSKLSKPNGEEVCFMEAFHNANVDSIPEHLKADYSEVQYQERFSKAKTEPVTIFVSKVMQEATDVMAESRFKKVQEILASEECKESFLKFLQTEHCDELLQLADKIDETTKLRKTEKIEAANTEIFETFIEVGAPMEVNLEAKMQARLEEDFKDPAKRKSRVLFLPAKKELFNQLDFEFNRFKSCSDYASLESIEREKDVEKWKSNFNDVMDDPIGRKMLLHFMMLEKNEENLLFF